jgi:putative endonuclease
VASVRKIAAVLRGKQAERRAVWLLRLKGYVVLARNFRPVKTHGLGEIDIIARRGRTLVFVEVKARSDEAAAIFSIRPEQQARITRAVAHFVKMRPAYRDFGIRYDAMVLEAGRFWPRHIIDVWRA